VLETQTSETASHVLGDCEALAAIRFKYLGYHFMKPGDFKDICKQDTALCSKCGAAKQINIRAAQRIRNGRCARDALVSALLIFYSIRCLVVRHKLRWEYGIFAETEDFQHD
jgi:hypothetical protein